MPGTTRYSATFDRPYEEEERRAIANGAHRSRSQSWQAMGGTRPYTPLANNRPSQRSSSTDSDPSKGLENIPTRTATKTIVKTHNNPFQFVKVGTCPLYKKAEEQLKKVKEVKKPEVLKEEEEEWQTNLDSWKSRRRKMSADVFRRQEEIKQFEQMEQSSQTSQKKTKTFSEMVESRARQGRALSLCLMSSPLDIQQWEENNKNNSSHPFSEESEENSVVNSEDEETSEIGTLQTKSSSISSTNGMHKLKNKSNKLFELGSPIKDGIYVDSGLESISSSHRTIDTPDSCSEFSQDSGSSIDCDSPRNSGLILNCVNLLEDYTPSSVHKSDSSDSFLSMKTNGQDVSSENMKNIAHTSSEFQENNHDRELLSSNGHNSKTGNSIESCMSQSSISDECENGTRGNKHERSVESENEVFVDDFEELNSKAHSSNSSEADVAKDVSDETLQDKNLPLSNSPFLHSSSSNNIGPELKKTNILKTKDIEWAIDKSNDSETHSQEKVTDTKDTKKRPRKKRPTAKIVSVEISNTKPDSVQNEPFDNRPCLDEGSLNVVFKSPSWNTKDVPVVLNSDKRSSSVSLSDVLPVEKVAEEMEKLILQQLEEEERAKELSNKSVDILESPEHNLTAPSRVAEPPKEKPPPPPSSENEVQKTPTVIRVNSTKRIKKEIHKRRSNFLGIDSTDENAVCDESLVRRPPGLEEILKAEMELDRESIKQLECAAAQRIKVEENEIIKREREIIANLETEERQKHMFSNEELCDMLQEKDRIEQLKDERKRTENERLLAETQILRLTEEKQLREREEYIRKQEEGIPTLAELSSRLLSGAVNTLCIPKSNAYSLSSETKPTVLLSGIIGEGKSDSNSASGVIIHSTESSEKTVPATKPVVPPKPLKKKEAIRKERERLRQEQEDLQREREEHRQKLLKQPDELSKTRQKPNASLSRPGPIPPAKPAYPPKPSNSPISTQLRENVIFTSQSYAAHNDISSNIGEVDPALSGIIKHKPVISHKKIVQKGVPADVRIPQKVSPIKKQPSNTSPESKYNQNHWLIQEAEMRRIAELKERQLSAPYPISQPHLAEDEVCSQAPLLSPVNAPLKEKVWIPNVVVKKHPPPVVAEKPLGIFPREQIPSKPSRIVPMEHMLSVSGRKRCSHCNEELGRGAAMIIESLQLYYHIQCFQCCVCQAQLGNGSCGTDVRVRNNKLHCHNCYSNDEAGLKFSQV